MDLGNLPLFNSLDEQVVVGFTGRLNVLDRFSRQMWGVVVMKDGEIFGCQYRGAHGLKAFLNMCVESAELLPQDFVVEPEIIEDDSREFHFSYSQLKEQTQQMLESHFKVVQHRPPDQLRLMARADFLRSSQEPISAQDFQVLCDITEWNKVEDLYRNCPLADHQITESLVNLRKKEAIKVIALRSSTPWNFSAELGLESQEPILRGPYEKSETQRR